MRVCQISRQKQGVVNTYIIIFVTPCFWRALVTLRVKSEYHPAATSEERLPERSFKNLVVRNSFDFV